MTPSHDATPTPEPADATPSDAAPAVAGTASDAAGDAGADATPTRRWDAFRWIGVAIGLATLPVTALALPLMVRDFAQSHNVSPVPLILTVGIMGVLAGLVAGSRFFSLYVDYAEHLNPTAALSEEDAAKGDRSVSGMGGDMLWGVLAAGVAGAAPVTLGMVPLFGPLSVVFFPVYVLTMGLTWFTGWAAGTVVGLIFSTALGIAVGSSRRRAGRLTWVLVAAFLPLLLMGVAVPAVGAGTTTRGTLMGAIGTVMAGPFDPEAWSIPEGLFVATRVALWVALVLLMALVVIGTPALVARLAGRASREN